MSIVRLYIFSGGWNDGKTYLYLFCKNNTKNSFVLLVSSVESESKQCLSDKRFGWAPAIAELVWQAKNEINQMQTVTKTKPTWRLKSIQTKKNKIEILFPKAH